MRKKIDAVVLFSGGLDSLLAARLLQDMGLAVLCLHFTSPFFGSARRIARWREIHGLNVRAVDASMPFVQMLASWPPNDIGKTLNPCVDCKITLLRMARTIMTDIGASFIATGEVLGQRPMSQRMETLNIIARDSGTRQILLRPLSAQLLPPTPMEESGLVDRSRLLRFSGRGRNAQMELAASMGITEIPTPGGGCRLTEKENARRYWPLLRPFVLASMPTPCNDALSRFANAPGSDNSNIKAGSEAIQALAADFCLANRGRMHARAGGGYFLIIGRNEADNAKIMAHKNPDDMLLRLPFPGPLGLARRGALWPQAIQREAAAILASYAPAKRAAGDAIGVRLQSARGEACVNVPPQRHERLWGLPSFDEVHEEIKLCRKQHQPKPKGAKHETGDNNRQSSSL